MILSVAEPSRVSRRARYVRTVKPTGSGLTGMTVMVGRLELDRGT